MLADVINDPVLFACKACVSFVKDPLCHVHLVKLCIGSRFVGINIGIQLVEIFMAHVRHCAESVIP